MPTFNRFVSPGATRRVALDKLAWWLYVIALEATSQETAEALDLPESFYDLSLETRFYWRERAARVAAGHLLEEPDRDGPYRTAAARAAVMEQIGATAVARGGFIFPGELYVNACEPALAAQVRDLVVSTRPGRAGVVRTGDHFVAFEYFRRPSPDE